MDDNRYTPNTNYTPRIVGDDWDTGRHRKKGNGKTGAVLVICCTITALLGGLVGGIIATGLVQDQIAAGGNSFQIPVSQPATNAGGDPTTGQVSNKGSLSGEQIVKQSQQSVVGLTLEVTEGYMQGEAVASGVIISADGYILTNYHVVSGATKIGAIMPDGGLKDAEVVGKDEITDLAVIRVEAKGLVPMEFADSSQVLVGQRVFAIGNPLGAEHGSVTQGIISAIDREVSIEDKTMTVLQTDAAINPGNSGGALVNELGSLVGVVNAKTAGVQIEGLGYAIPANDAKLVAEEIVTHGYVSGRPQLGISVTQIPMNSSNSYDDSWGSFGFGIMPDSSVDVKLQITNVEKGSAADEAGIQQGDIILEFDGEEVKSLNGLNSIKLKHDVGDSVVMKVSRGNEILELDIKLKENTKPKK